MEKQPDDMVVCHLECVLMPQGEIISKGKTLGWFKDFAKFLTPAADPVAALAPEMARAILALVKARHESSEAMRRASYSSEVQAVFDAVEKIATDKA